MGEPAVVAVSGIKNSGKTTLIDEMLPYFFAQGLRVAVIKHDGHSFPPDPPGTDTARHMAAGACGTAIFDGENYKIVRRGRITERELLPFFPDADLILLEGLKDSAWPKLELVRGAVSSGAVCDPKNLLALVTDLDLTLPGVPRISLDDPAGAAAVILRYLRGRQA